jgi:outer membrane lipopolysaccharide assembly protein LptE/RlpB
MRKRGFPIFAWFCLLAVTLPLWGGCGYRMGRVAPGVGPEGAGKRIAVPIFENLTFEPLLERQTVDAIKEELITRGWNVVNRPQEADAVLKGKITLFELIPISLDPQSQVAEYRVHLAASLTLETPPPSVRVIWKEADWEGTAEFSAASDTSLQRANEDRAIREASRRLAVRLSRRLASLTIPTEPGSQ